MRIKFDNYCHLSLIISTTIVQVDDILRFARLGMFISEYQILRNRILFGTGSIFRIWFRCEEKLQVWFSS